MIWGFLSWPPPGGSTLLPTAPMTDVTLPSTSTQGSSAHSPACSIPACLSGSLACRWLIPYPYVSDLKARLPPDLVSLSDYNTSQPTGAPKILEPESAIICPSTATQRAFCPHPQPEGTFHLLGEEHQAGGGRRHASPSLRASPFTSLELPAAQG